MTDEEKTIEEQPEEEITAADYVGELDRIKRDMVSKAEYERVLKENKTLADSLARGGAWKEEEDKVTREEIDGLRKKLFGDDTHYRNNMDYFTDVLRLRKGLIENGEDDPFLPHNKDYAPTEADHAKADYIAQQLEECLEFASGDPQLFNVNLQRMCGVKNQKLRR